MNLARCTAVVRFIEGSPNSPTHESLSTYSRSCVHIDVVHLGTQPLTSLVLKLVFSSFHWWILEDENDHPLKPPWVCFAIFDANGQQCSKAPNMDVFLILFKFKNSLATVAVCSDLDCTYVSLLKSVRANVKKKQQRKKSRHVCHIYLPVTAQRNNWNWRTCVTLRDIFATSLPSHDQTPISQHLPGSHHNSFHANSSASMWIGAVLEGINVWPASREISLQINWCQKHPHIPNYGTSTLQL